MIESLLFGLLTGFALGLTGGGGSVFAVPLVVYGLGMPLHEAVVISLAAVGATALGVDWRGCAMVRPNCAPPLFSVCPASSARRWVHGCIPAFLKRFCWPGLHC